MNGKTKTERHQERKVQKRQAATRKVKTTRYQTEAHRRQADLVWRKRQQQPGLHHRTNRCWLKARLAVC